MWQAQTITPLLSNFIPPMCHGYYSDNDSISIGGSTQGPPGPVGPQGPKGDTGPMGPQGPSGSQSLIPVKQVSYDYTPTAADTYIGCTVKNIVITLPLGTPSTVGKLYIIKNESSEGNIKVVGSGGQTLDDSSSKTLGSQGMLLAIYVNPRWSLI